MEVAPPALEELQPRYIYCLSHVIMWKWARKLKKKRIIKKQRQFVFGQWFLLVWLPSHHSVWPSWWPAWGAVLFLQLSSTINCTKEESRAEEAEKARFSWVQLPSSTLLLEAQTHFPYKWIWTEIFDQTQTALVLCYVCVIELKVHIRGVLCHLHPQRRFLMGLSLNLHRLLPPVGGWSDPCSQGGAAAAQPSPAHISVPRLIVSMSPH